MNISEHAKIRLQQRAIPSLIVTWLVQFGATEYSHGVRKMFFDKESRKRLKKEFGAEVIERLGDLLDIYIVIGEDERLITAAPRNKRIWRH